MATWTYFNDAMSERWVLPKQSYATAALAVAGIVRGLVDTTGLWVAVEAYSSTGGAQRIVASGGGTTLDNANFNVANFSWYGSRPLAAGDWIILRSTNPSGNKCQIYIEYDSATSIKFCLIPLNDWTTGGTAISPPDNQGFSAYAIGTSQGAAPGLVSLVVQAAVMDYSVVADSSTIVLIADDGVAADRGRIYIGKVKASHPDDTIPFVISTITTPGLSISDGCFARLSPFDMTTGLFSSAQEYGMYYSVGSYIPWLGTSGLDGKNDKWSPDSMVLAWTTAPDRHRTVHKFTYLVSIDLSSSGTLSGSIGPMQYMYMAKGGAPTAREAWDWDLATTYP